MLSTELNGMMERLQEILLCLPRVFSNGEVLKSRLWSVCADVEACRLRLAKQEVSQTVMGVIADLQTSVATYQETSHADCATPLALVTDLRRFRSTPTPPWRGRRFQNTPRKCIVCGKSGCWSTNHPKYKRLEALRKNKTFYAFIADLFDGSIKEGTSEPIHTDDSILLTR